MTDLRHVQLLIAGTGCAGHTAAIYAARAGLKPLVLEGDAPGGQLSLTSDVENFPGFPEGVGGFELVHRMRQQAEKFGAVYEMGRITGVTPGESFRLEIDGGESFLSCKALIIATGATARRLHVPGESEWFGNGVSTCATCDGAFYKERTVVVTGGGDSAMEEALFLTRFASRVHLVHRRATLRASKIMQERALHHERITMHWNSEIVEVHGDAARGVTGVEVIHHPEGNPGQKLAAAGGDLEKAGVAKARIDADGFFLAIGHVPNSGFVRGLVEMDEEGYIRTLVGPGVTENVRTNVPGIFACGDVVDKRWRQAITAAGMGCAAAMAAEHYLALE